MNLGRWKASGSRLGRNFTYAGRLMAGEEGDLSAEAGHRLFNYQIRTSPHSPSLLAVDGAARGQKLKRLTPDPGRAEG